MPVHHGGYPETHPVESDSLHDRGDGKRRDPEPPHRLYTVPGPIAARYADDGAEPCVGYVDQDRSPFMPYDTALTFNDLQHANRERGKLWCKGRKLPLEYSAMELGGEAGELIEALAAWEEDQMSGIAIAAKVGRVLNACKKYAREQYGMAGPGTLEAVKDELADVVICCSLLANKLDIDLGAIVARKFNKTSEKHGFPTRLAA